MIPPAGEARRPEAPGGRGSLVRLGALALALALARPAAAGPGLSLVRVEDLPQDEAVLQAWADTLAQEPYAASWAPEWKHQVPKERVAKALGASLATLRGRARRSPSPELLLAVGIAARYAHNVDVEGAPEAGVDALTRAASLSPGDPRPEWYLGANLCAMGQVEGLAHLDAARTRGGERLPPAYWGTVFECAIAGGMPAHALDAARQLERAGGELDGLAPLVANARALLREPGDAGEIPTGEAWTEASGGEPTRVVNRPCGFAFPRRPEWSFSPVKRGVCYATGPLGPFPGKTGSVWPSVLVIARRARAGESAEAFVGSFPFLAQRSAATGYPCPAGPCRTFLVTRPETYAHEGGGFAVATVIEREEPEQRGLALETPQRPQVAADGKTHSVRPLPRYVRFPGKMYYLVLLDSAQSVAESARAEYRRFLTELAVE